MFSDYLQAFGSRTTIFQWRIKIENETDTSKAAVWQPRARSFQYQKAMLL